MDKIAKVQSNRIDDQRASPKIFKNKINTEFLRHSKNLSARTASGFLDKKQKFCFKVKTLKKYTLF